MPTAWFDSMNGLLCIILCPIFAESGLKMETSVHRVTGNVHKDCYRNYHPLVFCTGSMVLAALSGRGTKDPVDIWVIIPRHLYVCHSRSYLPHHLPNAFISKYAPKKLLGTMLGVWPLIIFFSGKAYGPLYNWLLELLTSLKHMVLITIFIVPAGVIMLAFTKVWDQMVEGK